MASTRPTRKSSRKSSPFNRNAKESPIPSVEQKKAEKKKTAMENWVEPPLRPPAPSFEDYKGLERHGVLEHMAPLGTLPSAKLKAKFKVEPPRRVVQVRSNETHVKRELRTTPETTPVLGNRRSESRRVESQVPATPVNREPSRETISPSKTSTRSSTRPLSAQPSPLLATSRSPAWRARTKQVVDAAIHTANVLHHRHLGIALKKLYDDSLSNRNLSDLLEAVVAERPTPRQSTEFQNYLKTARSQFRNVQSASRKAQNVAVADTVQESPSASNTALDSSRSGTATRSRKSAGVIEAMKKKSSSPAPNLPQKEEASQSEQPEMNGRPAKRHKSLPRSQSTSSSSSLSSAPSLAEFVAGGDGVQHANTARILADERPMTNPKSQTSLGPTTQHMSSTPNHSNTDNDLKRSSNSAGIADDETDQALAVKRQRLSRTFDDVEIRPSQVRVSPSPKEPEPSQSVAPKSTSSLSAPIYPTRLRNGTIKKLAGDEDEAVASAASSFQGDVSTPGAAVTTKSSRPGTPTVLGRTIKKTKKTARVKMSPIKKKSGVIAGIARSGGEQDSPVGSGTTGEREDDNNDFCSACGGNGDLLCCDGCDRSFHFTCLDPPLDKDALPETWFCYVCAAKRDPPPRHSRGLFAALLSQMERKNPVAYNLPLEVRDYFEGVKTGEEGEYEEAIPQKSRTRAGYDEVPDLLKLKDMKGKLVLCYRCGKSSLGHQEIIPCDYCNLQWHLDCLDPPMANPPPRAAYGKPRNNWMCPNHVEHELGAIDPSIRANTRAVSTSGGRTHKVRRPKNARIIDTALRRGFVNDGLIEIENEPSDFEEQVFFDQQEFGVVYRLPERGVKLDFIDKIKKQRQNPPSQAQSRDAFHLRATQGQREVSEARVRQREELEKRSFIDQKAALNLAQFSQANSDLNLGVDEVDNLITTLIAEAPTEVVSLLSESVGKASIIPPSPPSSDSRPDQPEPALSQKERNTLQVFQELIRRRLEGATVTA
ncbi:MAG: hypothetical protein M1837_004982 [Sclerophora amabilis]|nr:MAG: hypothetical protein M1837_004982 [Sclerophora amabilis]